MAKYDKPLLPKGIYLPTGPESSPIAHPTPLGRRVLDLEDKLARIGTIVDEAVASGNNSVYIDRIARETEGRG